MAGRHATAQTQVPRWVLGALAVLAAAAALALMGEPVEAQMPPAAPPAPSPANCDYIIDNNAAYNWVEISANGTGMSSWTADTVSSWVSPNPVMPFWFCGAYTWDFLLASKGHMCFGNPPSIPAGCGNCCSAPSGLPASWTARPGVWAYYADLHPGKCAGGNGGSCIFWKVIGNSPNRQFIYEFTDVPFWCCSGGVPQSFQTKLFETSGCIEVHYKSVAPTPGNTWYDDTAAGYQAATGTEGWQYAHATTGFTASNTAWRACPAKTPPPPPPRCSPLTQVMAPGPATVSAVGGKQPYSWKVTPAAGVSPAVGGNVPTFVATYTQQGTHDVVVTDANGQSSKCSVTVVVPGCGYTVNESIPYDFDDIDPAVGGGGTPLSGQYLWTTRAVQPSPAFTFDFCGASYETFWLAGSGFICMGPVNKPTGTSWGYPSGCANYWTQGKLPSGATPNAAVYGYWSWLDPGNCKGGSASCLSYKVEGVAPNRVLIYQFKDVPWYWNSQPYQTFQIKLFEASDCIEVHYKDVQPAPSWNWVSYYPVVAGYENGNGQGGYQYEYQANYAQNFARSKAAWGACPFGAGADYLTFNEDQGPASFEVLWNDNGAGEPFEMVSHTKPTQGTLTGPVDGVFTYRPNPNFAGTDGFTYEIETPSGKTSTGHVTLTVNAVNDAPSADIPSRVVAIRLEPEFVGPGWAKAVIPAPAAAADEATQTITFEIVSNSDPALFDEQPTVERALNATDTEGGDPTVGEWAVLKFRHRDIVGISQVCLRPVDSGGTATVTNTWGETATGQDRPEPTCVDVVINSPPVAYFEPNADEVPVGEPVTFYPCPRAVPECTYDPDGRIDAYMWDFGDGYISELAGPTHAFSQAGAYAVRLSVRDEVGEVATYVRTVVALGDELEEDEEEVSLQAVAGPDIVAFEGQTVQLLGSHVGGGNGTTFAWSQVIGPGIELEDPQAPVTSFVAPRLTNGPTSAMFQLAVQDGDVEGEPDFAVVHILSNNSLPVADAGAPQRADAGVIVTLDGSGSLDADGEPLSFHWEQLPGGPRVPLSDPASPTPTFVAPEWIGTLEFRLRVSDGRGGHQAETMVVLDPAASAARNPDDAPEPGAWVAGGAPSTAQAWWLPIGAGAAVMLLVAVALVAYLRRKR